MIIANKNCYFSKWAERESLSILVLEILEWTFNS